MSSLKSIKVFFDNGDYLVTSINGEVSDKDITDYYVGKLFNLGQGGNDLMVRAVRVEFL